MPKERSINFTLILFPSALNSKIQAFCFTNVKMKNKYQK